MGGGRVRLVDTGGYTIDAGRARRRGVPQDAEGGARSRTSLLLVLDAVETTPLDEEFIRLMRPFSDKVLLVVNKVDTPGPGHRGVERPRPRFPARHRRLRRARQEHRPAAGDRRGACWRSSLRGAAASAQSTAPPRGRARRLPERRRRCASPSSASRTPGKSSLANRLLGRGALHRLRRPRNHARRRRGNVRAQGAEPPHPRHGGHPAQEPG